MFGQIVKVDNIFLFHGYSQKRFAEKYKHLETL